MSYESENAFPAGTRLRDVREFVQLLGFNKLGVINSKEFGRFENFSFFEEKEYRSWSGVELAIRIDGTSLSVSTRSASGRSYYDLEKQNLTIASLKRRFGGTFVTDEGRNRYLRSRFGPPPPPASGCYLAFWRLGGNLIRASSYLDARQFPSQKNEELLRSIGHSPANLSNNLLLPFLVAALEEYLKSAFIAILRYSNRKDAIFRGLRLQGDQLAAISNGKSVEEQIAETLPFQRISAVTRNFALLDPKLDIAGVLKKPYRRRKQSLFNLLEEIVTTRHDFIHRAKLDTTLTDSRMHELIYDLDDAMTRIADHLTAHYKWPTIVRSWHLGNRRVTRRMREERRANAKSEAPTVDDTGAA
jgi:hypothetical protein